MKKILVTGGCGFIGSHLVEYLCNLNHEVTVVTKYSSSNTRGNLNGYEPNNINFITGDITDSSFIESAIKGKDVVFNLAALIGIPYSYHNPRHVQSVNTNGVLNVLEAARKTECRVVHISTSEVYGTAEYTPIDEEHRYYAQSPYAASKVGADQLCLSYHCSFEQPISVIRPFNTFGPRQSMRVTKLRSLSTTSRSKRRRLRSHKPRLGLKRKRKLQLP